MNKLICCAFISVVLAACSKPSEADKTASTSSPTAKVEKVSLAHAATPEEWRAALVSTYEESAVKDKGDGVTSFMAKFKLPNEGVRNALGERDAFRKLRFYSVGIPMQISTGMKAYISVKDNDRPVLFLQPFYSGESWIFMNKIAVLVDGEIALEHECSNPDQDVHTGRVTEQCDFILQASEINALRKITDESKVSIRLTGKKGYVAVGRGGYNALKDFVRDIQSAIAIYDTMDNALKDHIPPASAT